MYHTTIALYCSSVEILSLVSYTLHVGRGEVSTAGGREGGSQGLQNSGEHSIPTSDSEEKIIRGDKNTIDNLLFEGGERGGRAGVCDSVRLREVEGEGGREIVSSR